MSDALPERPDIDPGSVSGSSFSRSRKGYEPAEVNSLLGRLADALRVWEVRDRSLTEQVTDLARRLEEAQQLDEAKVTEMLGAETARIVATAREAANEIRTTARTESDELLRTSREEATRTADALVAEATADREVAATARSEAEAESARILDTAREEASRLGEEASRGAEELRSEAAAAAESLRSEAAEAAERLRAEAEERYEELIARAGAVFAEKSAEAEEHATSVRATAEAELVEARSEAEQLRNEALEAAAAELERARSEGRAMVAEAREVRQRMMRDLAEKTRVARQKVEGAKAARAAVVDALRLASARVTDTIDGVGDSEQRAVDAADAAALGVPDEISAVTERFVALLERHGTAEPESSQDGAPPDASAPDAGASEAAASDTAASDTAAAGEPAEEDTGSSPGAGAEPDGDEAGAEPEGDASPTADDRSPGDAAAGGGAGMASVHDLFERLRASDTPSDGAPGAAPGTPEGDVAAGNIAAADTAVADTADADTDGDASERDTADADTADADTSAAEEPGSAGADVEEPGSAGADAEEPGDAAGATAVLPGEDRPEADEQGPTTDPDSGVLDRRDELLAPAERLMARNLKRVVGDEQNDVLDHARRIRKERVAVEDLLVVDDHLGRYTEALSGPYLLAATAGAQLWSELSGTSPADPAESDVDPMLSARLGELLESRRLHLRDAIEDFDESGGESAELASHLRAAYRELRSTSLPELAADLATAAFNEGVRLAAGPEARWRWVVDNGGLPCSDAEDNALEGPVACGSPFPTGDEIPPAHPGCRCIVVPESVVSVAGAAG